MARKLEELAEDNDDGDEVLNIGEDIKLNDVDEIDDDGTMKISTEEIKLNDVEDLPV